MRLRSFRTDLAEVAAIKIICLVLGISFITAGVIEAAAFSLVKGVLLMGIGCYVTAASALALHRGAEARRVFVPAGVTAIGALLAVSVAGGVFT